MNCRRTAVRPLRHADACHLPLAGEDRDPYRIASSNGVAGRLASASVQVGLSAQQ